MKITVIYKAYAIAACNAGQSDNQKTNQDASTLHPPSEAIPDSSTIVNDSLIKTDSGQPGQ